MGDACNWSVAIYDELKRLDDASFLSSCIRAKFNLLGVEPGVAKLTKGIEEYDEDGFIAFDETGFKNAEFVVACRPENVLKLIAALEQAQQEYQIIEQKLINAAVYIETLESEPRKTNLKQLNEIAGLKRKCAAYESGEYGFFAYWPQHGEELFKKREDAIEFCNEAIEDYRRENAEEGSDENEVRRVCWGVVMQAGIDVALDGEGHIDYALTPVLGAVEGGK